MTVLSEEKMYTVSAFAKLCGVTVRTLKYYEERHLLKPALIAENGYRYYNHGQMDEVSAILLFKDYGFSLDEISGMMKQDDLDGIQKRMDTLLSIIEDRKRRLQIQEENIRYTSGHVAYARDHLGKINFSKLEPLRLYFMPAEVTDDGGFIVNYLTDGLRSGTCFRGKDYSVCGRYREVEPFISRPPLPGAVEMTISGKWVCLYETGWPKMELIDRIARAAKERNIKPEFIFCEMILENTNPEKCLFNYFVAEEIEAENLHDY